MSMSPVTTSSYVVWKSVTSFSFRRSSNQVLSWSLTSRSANTRWHSWNHSRNISLVGLSILLFHFPSANRIAIISLSNVMYVYLSEKAEINTKPMKIEGLSRWVGDI